MSVTGLRLNLRGRATLLGLLLASCAAAGHAQAGCTPSSPVSNTTVTCSGATTDANGTTGYGTVSDTGNTYNIVSGASVTGTFDGLATMNSRYRGPRPFSAVTMR